MRSRLVAVAVLIQLSLALASAHADAPLGYYRQPAIHDRTVVFVAEGDLWTVPVAGGVATRLTTNLGDETSPSVSPDGKWLAFTAQYEGPTEAYVMPLAGGLPKRLTWDGARGTSVVGWKGNKVIAATQRFATLPSTQLTLIDPESGRRELIPLAQAADGCFDDSGKTLFFTRLAFQGSQTKRYKGGTAQNLWKFAEGAPEAVALTADFAGTSATPMWWKGRVCFLTDRDGSMDLWSMSPDGKDLKQLTKHDGFDVKSPALSDGRIVYQFGADLWLYDIDKKTDAKIDVHLSSDFDQTRENWVKKPMDWLTSVHIAPDGEHAALTARGQVFIAPRGQGRLVELPRRNAARYRDARFMPDGKTVVALSDESGEVEIWTMPADGSGQPAQLTNDGKVLRWQALPSPDGKWIANYDKNLRLWLYSVEEKRQTKIDESKIDDNFSDLAWSPDSQWLAYVAPAENLNRQVKIHNVRTHATAEATTDRYESFNPAWSPDGKWLYLLSDRHIESVVRSPWGPLQPEPYFDRKTQIYHIALKRDARSPFLPADELHPKETDKKGDDKKTEEKDKKDAPATAASGPDSQPASKPSDSQPGSSGKDKKEKPKPPVVDIDLDGIQARLMEVPIGPGNYDNLAVTEKRLLWISRPSERGDEPDLMTADIANKDVKPKALVPSASSFELSGDGKSILTRRKDSIYIIDSGASAPAALDEKAVDLSGWSFPLVPREEWRQMFTEAWRLERDYFYDLAMHGNDWKAVYDRFLPLVDRVSTRAELNDVLAQMVGELAALHIFVRGGDIRETADRIAVAALGATFVDEPAAAGDGGGGVRIEHIIRTDPDQPELLPPLAKPEAGAKEGDVIVAVNGRATPDVAALAAALRNQIGKQVLIELKSSSNGPNGSTKPATSSAPNASSSGSAEAEADDAANGGSGGKGGRKAIVTPISADAEADLRYHEWEYTRRLKVEEAGGGELGYVHLRAMGAEDIAAFARGFYPVFNRKGLVVDVRNNRGGNIDSWVISRLLRKPWMFWQPRLGEPSWNMQYAFPGHIVVLCNERTASDGEAFSEGVKRLKVGRLIGTRTWGGEIWLSSSNFLVDRGIATAAETGVYGPEGQWLIEGHGVEPDDVVDNLPHATFLGGDAQLDAAVKYLKEKIVAEPVEIPKRPPYPNKAYRPGS